jgi:hypothetical protein
MKKNLMSIIQEYCEYVSKFGTKLPNLKVKDPQIHNQWSLSAGEWRLQI